MRARARARVCYEGGWVRVRPRCTVAAREGPAATAEMLPVIIAHQVQGEQRGVGQEAVAGGGRRRAAAAAPPPRLRPRQVGGGRRPAGSWPGAPGASVGVGQHRPAGLARPPPRAHLTLAVPSGA